MLTKSSFAFIKDVCHNKQPSGDKSSASPDEKIYQQPKFSAFDWLFSASIDTLRAFHQADPIHFRFVKIL